MVLGIIWHVTVSAKGNSGKRARDTEWKAEVSIYMRRGRGKTQLAMIIFLLKAKQDKKFNSPSESVTGAE